MDNNNTPRKPRIEYSKELVDKIACKLSEDMSLKEISKYCDWSPSYQTLIKWALHDTYASHKFREAETLHLEFRKKQLIKELNHTDLNAIARECHDEPIDKAIKAQLFKAKVDHINKQIELAYKELEIELPKKYGKKLQQDLNITENVANLSLPELRDQLERVQQIIKDRKDVLTSLPDTPPDSIN